MLVKRLERCFCQKCRSQMNDDSPTFFCIGPPWTHQKLCYVYHGLLLGYLYSGFGISRSVVARGVDVDKKVEWGTYINVCNAWISEVQSRSDNRIKFGGTTMFFSFSWFFLTCPFLSHLLCNLISVPKSWGLTSAVSSHSGSASQLLNILISFCCALLRLMACLLYTSPSPRD